MDFNFKGQNDFYTQLVGAGIKPAEASAAVLLMATAQTSGYENARDYLSDSVLDVIAIVDKAGGRISRDDALRFLKVSDGNISLAAGRYLEDLDRSDPRHEAHYSPWWLNR